MGADSGDDDWGGSKKKAKKGVAGRKTKGSKTAAEAAAAGPDDEEDFRPDSKASGQPNGQGYTLSGKPLDPTSSAARAYGLKPEILERLQASDSAALAGFQSLPASASDQPEKENCSTVGEGDNQQAAAELPSNKRQKQTPKETKPPRPPKSQSEAAASTQSPPDIGPPPEPTEYAKNRPRRETGRAGMSLGHTTESLELVKCCDFVGPPGSGAPLAQPFQVEVEAQVHLVMDFHAHLSSCEIIGLLGGQWDSEKKIISIRQAFPCRRALGSHSGTSVELDPEAEVETRALMDAQGLTPVGWYHSHPIFAPKPSQKDNENQRNYQALFRCDKTRLEPFVGAIVGPYDMQLPTQASAFTWFVVQTRSGDLTPFSVRHTVKPMLAMPEEQTQQQLLDLTEAVKDDYGRVDLSSMWRPYSRLLDALPLGGPCSRLDKMRAALLLHLPSSPDSAAAVTDLILRLVIHIQTIWGLALGVKDGASNDTSAQAAVQGEVLVEHADAVNSVILEAAVLPGSTKDRVNFDTGAATAVIVAADQM
ncbi:hypothetical protein WJX79_005896 [Trebouxia sp. C0005]